METSHRVLAVSLAALLCGAGTAVAAESQAGAGATGAADAKAAGDSGDLLAEVVVTARKRAENAQKIPVSITAFTAEQLTEQGIKAPTDLARVVPSLDVQTETIAAGAAAVMFEIRGQVASHSVLEVSQAVGLYQDGVNIPHPGGANLGFFDLERVDVLKGPQGTLYGRNTTGGAVNVTTRGADFEGIHGYGEVDLGRFRNVRVAGAVNLPMSDQLAIRVAGQRWDREGFGRSATTGQRLGDDRNDWLSRASVLWKPSDTFSADLKFEYDTAHRNGRLEQPAFDTGGASDIAAGLESGATLTPGFCAAANLPFTCASIGTVAAAGATAIAQYVNNTDRDTNYQNGKGNERISVWHSGLTLQWDINDSMQLKSVSGLHKVSIFRTDDLDAMPFQIVEVNLPGIIGQQPTFGVNAYPDVRYTTLSQEFNLSGKAYDERLNWLLGAYGSTEKGDSGSYHIAVTTLIDAINNVVGSPNVAASAGAQVQDDVKSDTWALFSQADWHFTDQLFMTLGARYTQESLSHRQAGYNFYFGSGAFSCLDNPSVLLTGPDACLKPQSKDYSSFSYLGSLTYQLSPNHMVYAKTSRGNRAGALQAFAPPSVAEPAKPEVATDYEIGTKGEYLDRKLRVNLAAYRTNYRNMQAITIVANPLNPAAPWVPVTNAGRARIQGLEAEIRAVPVHNWSVYVNGSYTDGKYTDYKNAVTPGNQVVDATGLDITNQDTSHPKWRYNVGTRFGTDVGPGMLFASLDWSWRSHGILNASNLDVASVPALQPAYEAKQKELREAVGLLNARIDYELSDDGVTLSLYSSNLLNKRYETVGLLGSAIAGITTSLVQPPRMYGLTIRKQFGAE